MWLFGEIHNTVLGQYEKWNKYHYGLNCLGRIGKRHKKNWKYLYERRKLNLKFEQRHKEHLKSAIQKHAIKSVENKLIMSKWWNTPYNVSGMRHTTCVLLIKCVWERAIAIARLSYAGLQYQLNKNHWLKNFFSYHFVMPIKRYPGLYDEIR